MTYVMPELPRSDAPLNLDNVNAVQFIVLSDNEGHVLKNRSYRIWMADEKIIEGVTDKNGATSVLAEDSAKVSKIQIVKRQA